MLPGLLAWTIIFAPAIGGLFFPSVIAYGLLFFVTYWFIRSFKSAFFAIRGYFIIKDWEIIDWRVKWENDKTKSDLKFDNIKHLVIIPTYNESVSVLEKPLKSLVEQKQIDKKNLIVVLSFEARAEGHKKRAKTLLKKYKNEFGIIDATFHPDGIPGEIRGIAPNQTWGARYAEKIMKKKHIDFDYVTVTKGDADTIFHPCYFSALGYLFSTSKNRYLRFWQSPILWYNNLHKVPFPIKMLGVIGHAVHISDLQEPSRLIFNMSVYSLSFNLLYKTDYWHTDIIPEDWHFFLQTFFANKGDIEVNSLYLPTYIDAPEANTWFGSLNNRYQQCKRHAWGASDIPYMIKESIRHKEIPLSKRVARTYKMFETHVFWSTNWFILTLGALLPLILNPAFARTSLGYNLPKIAEGMLRITLIALLVMIIMDLIMRPDYAKPKTIWQTFKEFAQWVTLPIVTLPMAVLPGLHAQTMLLFGKRLEYRTTEKV